jgi:hypothetical protein
VNTAAFIVPLGDFGFNDFPLPFIERAEPFADCFVVSHLLEPLKLPMRGLQSLLDFGYVGECVIFTVRVPMIAWAK